MISQTQIKFIRSLREKKFRDETGLFVVEGEKMVEEVLKSRFKVEDVFRMSEIGENAMSRISMLSTPSPALALVRQPDIEWKPDCLDKNGLYIALDGIRDPGNMGTILRIADWFGIDGVFASNDSVDIFNSKVVQSTMGAIFRVRFASCDISELCARADVTAFGTFLKGENIYRADLCATEASVIVIGNESNGISEAVSSVCDKRLTIPSFAKGCGSESLNAAVATSIIVSEFRRRHG